MSTTVNHKLKSSWQCVCNFYLNGTIRCVISQLHIGHLFPLVNNPFEHSSQVHWWLHGQKTTFFSRTKQMQQRSCSARSLTIHQSTLHTYTDGDMAKKQLFFPYKTNATKVLLCSFILTIKQKYGCDCTVECWTKVK